MALPLDSILSLGLTTDTNIIRGSGTVLASSSGLYLITVAHFFDNYSDKQLFTITSTSGVSYQKETIYVHHGWDSQSQDYNNDIAIVKLLPQATTAGLSLWQSENYLGTEFVLTGFGNNGELHTGTNIFDADAIVFNQTHNKNIIEGTQILYDYDNGLEAQNSIFGYFSLPSSPAPTSNEALAKSGDSGGALLVDNQIAAITSYLFNSPDYDADSSIDSSAGEMGIATRINLYIPWIEYITSGNPQYAVPDAASDVLTSIDEPFAGEVINFFLLEMEQARKDTVTLQYITRAGTATAGEDYQHVQGQVMLLAGEISAAIGITIYGDTQWEEDETFTLVVTDITGQWIASNDELIATHTIINNDLY